MSTSHRDALISVLSRYLARHLSNADLRRELEQLGVDGLPDDPAELLSELLDELRGGEDRRGAVEVLVRETLEAIALS
jgi:hypothetical protein